MRKLLLLLPLIALAACGPSEQVRHQQFVDNCDKAFSKPQCEVLYSIKKGNDEAAASASYAASMSTFSAVMAASRH